MLQLGGDQLNKKTESMDWKSTLKARRFTFCRVKNKPGVFVQLDLWFGYSLSAAARCFARSHPDVEKGRPVCGKK